MNENSIQTFDYLENPVRVLTIDGEPWWVLADVCRVLTLTNSRVVAGRLDDDEKDTVNLTDTFQNSVSQTDGRRGNPNVTIVNEPGLYSVILRSDKPEAKAFKRWITHEVIPSIRKLGCYAVTMTEKEPFTNEQRIKVMDIISRCSKHTLPEVLKYCDPTWPVSIPDKAKEVVISMSVPERSDVGETIKALLKRHGMSQSALSEKSGCSKGAISQYCHGLNRPSERQWKKIMDVFADAGEKECEQP